MEFIRKWLEKRREKAQEKVKNLYKALNETREAYYSILDVYEYIKKHTSSSRIKEKIRKSQIEIMQAIEAIDELVSR